MQLLDSLLKFLVTANMARYASVWEGIDFDFEQTGSLPIAEYRFQMWIPIEEALVKKLLFPYRRGILGCQPT